VAGLSPAACALVIAVGLVAQPLLAQPFRLPTAPPASLSPEAQQSFEAKMDELARALANDPHLCEALSRTCGRSQTREAQAKR
jgi:hypothetical protein